MINYSIPKPHVLCGHFIQINSQQEYNRMKQIAEECGFNYVEGFAYEQYYRFQYNNTVKCYDISVMSGQQITLDELEHLVEISKIKLPQVMEVRDDGRSWFKHSVIDFYKGKPVVELHNHTLTIYDQARLINPHQAEIEKLEAEIKAAQAKLETLKNASK